jgi:hypothetical protein
LAKTFIQHRIIDAIKDMPDYVYSDDGQITSIEAICKILQGYKREYIVEGISEMDGVQLMDSSEGAIRIPASYFK